MANLASHLSDSDPTAAPAQPNPPPAESAAPADGSPPASNDAPAAAAALPPAVDPATDSAADAPQVLAQDTPSQAEQAADAAEVELPIAWATPPRDGAADDLPQVFSSTLSVFDDRVFDIAASDESAAFAAPLERIEILDAALFGPIPAAPRDEPAEAAPAPAEEAAPHDSEPIPIARITQGDILAIAQAIAALQAEVRATRESLAPEPGATAAPQGDFEAPQADVEDVALPVTHAAPEPLMETNPALEPRAETPVVAEPVAEAPAASIPTTAEAAPPEPTAPAEAIEEEPDEPNDPATDALLRDILTEVRSIAVVGLSANPERPSYQVFQFLKQHGYVVVGVNPELAGKRILGANVYRRLSDIPFPVDMVDIFRRSEAVAPIVDTVLAFTKKPKVIWMQIGVRDEAAAEKARAQGVKVVMNRCPKIEHARLFK